MPPSRAKGPLVHLIDASVYIFRAYYSLPEMHAPDGTPTNAAYGFANTLIRYLTEERPSHFAAAFDHSMDSFRNEIEPDYKGTRVETPADLEPQFPLCPRIAAAIGITGYERESFEADDVIATLTAQLLRRGARIRIVTTDKDLTQLVREDGRVTVYDFAKQVHFDADAVREKFGVDPAQIPDYLGLVGDSVDNLPGVPGVGPKSAAAALGAFRRIEDISADPADWSEVPVRGAKGLAARIDAHRERALKTRELATTRSDVPEIAATLREVAYRGGDSAEFETLFFGLGWEKIATRVPIQAVG